MAAEKGAVHLAIPAVLNPLWAKCSALNVTITFKQLLQAKALSYLQIDSCRLVNENLSVLLMAQKFQRKALQNAAAMKQIFLFLPSKLV
ncbi:LOW QUALITY PROTEIN: mitochondrial enolase superfamily member 1 [Phaethornis superciliosus]